MHIIVDYGLGNIASVRRAFERAGMETELTGDPEKIKKAKHLVLPGVGAFGDAMEKLESHGLKESILEGVANGATLLGICLGMQLLYEEGFEHGYHRGLGLFKGSVRELDVPLRIPHLGWNNLKFQREHPLFKYVKEGEHVYFIHSFYVDTKGEEVLATGEYAMEIPAVVGRENVYGFQFHPEKSGDTGHRLLLGYKELVE